MDVRGIVIQFQEDVRDFSFPQTSIPNLVPTHPLNQRVLENFPLGIKRENRESNRSPPSLPILSMIEATFKHICLLLRME
jgi:hypothetical protein